MPRMAKNGPPIIIALITLTTVAVSYLLNHTISSSEWLKTTPEHYTWLVHGLVNTLGYATVFLPGYLTYKYVRKINYINRSGSGICGALIRTCFGEEDLPTTSPPIIPPQTFRTPREDALLLLFYFFGLQTSYLLWGLLQEKVMTQEYVALSGDKSYFKDSQFLVFVNRILAFLMSGVYVMCQRQPRHRCPLYKYVFCSFSNVMSSWCQYEALKYVSFPHQVLAKAAKTIPVMIMGKIVSRAKYEFYEYATAVLLSLGMLLFMLDAGNDRATSTVTTVSGVILLGTYVAFDSFTSNWQGALFKQYHVTPVQMMCFVNFFSCIFTGVSLLQQGGFLASLDFMIKYPSFIFDCVLLSVCSASGQLFIFSTISNFGPVIFAIISTIRQGLSVLLSCLVYGHHVDILGIFGILLVFVSVLLRIYCGYRLREIRSGQKITKKVIT